MGHVLRIQQWLGEGREVDDRFPRIGGRIEKEDFPDPIQIPLAGCIQLAQRVDGVELRTRPIAVVIPRFRPA